MARRRASTIGFTGQDNRQVMRYRTLPGGTLDPRSFIAIVIAAFHMMGQGPAEFSGMEVFVGIAGDRVNLDLLPPSYRPTGARMNLEANAPASSRSWGTRSRDKAAAFGGWARGFGCWT